MATLSSYHYKKDNFLILVGLNVGNHIGCSNIITIRNSIFTTARAFVRTSAPLLVHVIHRHSHLYSLLA